jgi:hypothetical protein
MVPCFCYFVSLYCSKFIYINCKKLVGTKSYIIFFRRSIFIMGVYHFASDDYLPTNRNSTTGVNAEASSKLF